MHSLQEARTLGPLCGRSLICAISKIYAETDPLPNYEFGGQEFESLRARHKINDLAKKPGLEIRISPGFSPGNFVEKIFMATSMVADGKSGLSRLTSKHFSRFARVEQCGETSAVPAECCGDSKPAGGRALSISCARRERAEACPGSVP